MKLCCYCCYCCYCFVAQPPAFMGASAIWAAVWAANPLNRQASKIDFFAPWQKAMLETEMQTRRHGKKMKKTWSLSGRKRIYWMYTKRQWNFASGQFPILKSSLWRWVVFRLSECDLCDLWLVWLVSLFPFLVLFVAGTCACLETFVYFCDVSEESAMLCRILSADLASSQPLSCQAGSLRAGHSFFEAWWHLHGKHAAFIIFVC